MLAFTLALLLAVDVPLCPDESFRRGLAALDAGRLAEAARCFEACEQAEPRNAKHAFYRACVAARAMESDVAMASLVRDFPMFRGVTVAERWAGLIDVTPDAVPVISAIDQLPGLYVATGFSGHGFGIGPGAGRLMAELVTGAAPVVDPAPFRFSRFIDGSRPVPMTGF